ncbi:hypothetical protein NEOLI_000830 [Neolecta irregularis DAH-3]|uniref:Uncharacterized protein n=1 Tax=Neolecta irregularis (strain DAH-3) TaxID=1198029 RepID=A0A1U7LRI2_NEOID|nr:hypothetical protein NEOLI_000830 [Neolecta irregularis DAH-3]|eukprot:OLL25254.1 hypothetical protein NEOLI_000830 [Neolecta irregularis DAH-3]
MDYIDESQDHFTTYLNEPAGKIAIVIVKHTVGLITKAWFKSDIEPRSISNEILSAFHHPALRGRDNVQNEMFEVVRSWIEERDSSACETILEGLTAEGVKEGRNQNRLEGENTTQGCGRQNPLNYSEVQEKGSAKPSNELITPAYEKILSEKFANERPDEFGYKQALGYAKDSFENSCEELDKYGERPSRTNVAHSSGETFSSKQRSRQDIPCIGQDYESSTNQLSNQFEIEVPTANGGSNERNICESSSQSMSSYNDMGNQFDMMELRGKSKYERQYEDEMS